MAFMPYNNIKRKGHAPVVNAKRINHRESWPKITASNKRVSPQN